MRRSHDLKGARTISQREVPVLTVAYKADLGIRYQEQRKQRGILILTLGVSDAVMISLALLLAWYLRIGSGLLAYHAPSNFPYYRQMILFSVLIFWVIFFLSGLYRYNVLLGGPQEYGLVFQSCSFGVIALVLVSFIEHNQPLSRGWLLMSWALSLLFVGVTRFCWRRVFQALRKRRGWLIMPTLIVGVNEHAKTIARQLATENAGVQIVGFVDEFLPKNSQVLDGFSVIGSPNQIQKLCLQYEVQQIIFLPNAVTWETFQEIIQKAGYENGYETYMSPGFFEILASNVQVTHKAFVPLLRLEQARITGIDFFLKFALDYGFGIVLVLISLPFMGVISLAILLTDGRPIFTRHKVLGLGGKPFQTIKFRTSSSVRMDLHPDQNVSGERSQNTQADFRLGRFLYRTGLDKLPQLLDVLRGHLSLVGPRTIPVDSQHMGHSLHPSLLTVKPGWIGPWSMEKVRTEEAETNLNLYYIRNWTIWLDLQVLYQAFKVAVSGQRKPNK